MHLEGNTYRKQAFYGRSKPAQMSTGLLMGLLAMGQFLGILLLTEQAAHAYVDPGSGFLTLQMLGAWMAGGLFVLRHKLKRIFAKKTHAPADGDVAAGREIPMRVESLRQGRELR